MDYQEIDKDMSSWVITTVRNGYRFYVADNESETATDILARAKRYRWQDLAEMELPRLRREFGWPGWEAKRIPEMLAE